MALNPTRLTIPRLNLSKSIPPEELAVLLNRWADSVAHAFSEVKGAALAAAHTAHKAISTTPTGGALTQDAGGTIINEGAATFSPTGAKLPAPPGKQVTQDNLKDGNTYARVLSSALVSGAVRPPHISKQSFGPTLSVSLCNVTSNTLTSPGAWGIMAQPPFNVGAGISSLTLQITLASGGAGACAVPQAVGIAIYSGGAPATPQASTSTGNAFGTYTVTLNNPDPTGTTLGVYVQAGGTGASKIAVTSSMTVVQTAASSVIS